MLADELAQLIRDPLRLEAVRRSALLDTPTEERFDRLARLAAYLMRTPIALLSVVDEERQFFKSAIGLDDALSSRRELPLIYSYCKYTVQTGETLVIDDARKHPLVRGSPSIHEFEMLAYAGVPLKFANGQAIGAFCVIDRQARSWSQQDIARLEDLAASVLTEIEIRLVLSPPTLGDTHPLSPPHQNFMQQVSSLLAESIDASATLPELAKRVLPTLGDYCVIELEEDEDPQLRRLAAAHRVPQKQALLDSHVATGTGPPSPASSALPGLDVRASMSVPLRARRHKLGRLEVGITESDRRYTPEDLALLFELADQVAVALDNWLLYRRASASVRKRDEFVSVAAHELKTPLTTLQLQLDTLAGMLGLQPLPLERVTRGIDSARRQCRRLGKLVSTMLDVSRISSGRLELELEPLELDEVVKETVGRFSEEARQTGSELSLSIEGPVRGWWDRVRLEQVLSNLLSNALKYGRGGPIQVRLKAEDGLAQLTVKDSGVGIPPDALERIFEPFERAVAPHSFGGLGLGLYVAQQIVEAHGGDIWVMSHPGRGATFTVLLPLRPAARPPTASQPASSSLEDVQSRA